jgi:uncharacterized protein with HEPN domain
MPDETSDMGYLFDMLQHALGVSKALRDRTAEDYMQDENLRLAIERRIEIIGEAARRISQRFRDAHPEIPWRKIIAQRNVLAHEYGEIQDEMLWELARVSIPNLISAQEKLVPRLED